MPRGRAILNQTLATTQQLADKLQRSFDNIYFTPAGIPISSASPWPTGASLRETNRRTGVVIDRFTGSPHFAISRTALGVKSYAAMVDDVVGQWHGVVDDDHLLVIRMVVMSPYLGDAATTDALLDEFVAELRSFALQ